MKKTTRMLSMILSICMFVSVTLGFYADAYALSGYNDKVLITNVDDLIEFIEEYGELNVLDEWEISKSSYSGNKMFDTCMAVDDDGDLYFELDVYDTENETLAMSTYMFLDEPTEEVKRVFTSYYGTSSNATLEGYVDVGRDFYEEAEECYISNNYYDVDTETAGNLILSMTDAAFVGWDNLLNEYDLNLGAVGFYNYCDYQEWSSYKVSSKATTTAKGKKTCYCEICGKIKTATIAKDTFSVKAKSAKTVKYSSLKKKNVTIKCSDVLTVKNAKGKVTYKKTSGNSKITVSGSGKITVKKGLKKGTYKVKIKVTEAGNSCYKQASKTVTVTIKVK